MLDAFGDTDADKVRLTVTEYAPTPKFAEWARLDGHELADTSWTRVGTQTFTGTTSNSEMLLAEQAGGKARLRLACSAHAQPVLAPGAKSVDGSCEGRPPQWWLPPATHDVTTYGCQIVDGDDAGLMLELSEPPGIEYVAENSDCTFQNAAYRAVAPRSVATH